MANITKFNSLFALTRAFRTEKECKDFLIKQRWADGDVICPYCGEHHCVERKDGRFRCKKCRLNSSVTVDTIFENTKLPLLMWFMAMYLIASHKKGISSHQLAKDIDVSQKTAWFMAHKIRTLFEQDSTELEGEVEMDEAYIGGAEKNKHESKKTENNQGRSLKTKSAVFGMVQRDGNVVAKKTENTQGKTLMPIIRQFVKPNSRVFTDEYIGYHSLTESEYEHSIVFHKDKQFIIGAAHTNTIEGFWGQLKRSIFGIYHFVSGEYLQRYVDEAVFRYNTREMNGADVFETLFNRAVDGYLYYEDVLMVA